MDKTEVQLQKQLQQEKQINKFLNSEIDELKKINAGLRNAYEEGLYYQQLVAKYQNYFPYIEKFRKSIIFKVIKKIRRKK